MSPGDRSILIIEDDPDLRGAVAALLGSKGYRTLEAGDGRQGLAHLTGGSAYICLILLDLFMPEMNGWSFRAEQVNRPELASIPVVVVSADDEAARRALLPGVVAALSKPVDFDRLLHIIGQHC